MLTKSSLMQRARQYALYCQYILSLLTGKGFRANYFSGTLPKSKTPINLLFLGPYDHISPVLFAGNVSPERLGTFHPLSIKKAIARYKRADTDIIVIPHLPWKTPSKDNYVLPAFLEAKVTLPSSMDEFMANLRSSNRRKINQSLKKGTEFELAGSKKDYREFYETMLVPLVTKRHGENAFVPPLETLYAKADNAVLFFAKLNGKRIGGAQMILPTSSKPFAYSNKLGMADEIIGDFKLFKLVNMSIYYQMCKLSIERGISCLNLGMASPAINHGLLWFKKGWGADFHVNSNHYCSEMIFCSKARREIQEQCHFVHFENGKLVATAGVTEEIMSKKETLSDLKRGKFKSLNHINLLYPDGRKEELI